MYVYIIFSRRNILRKAQRKRLRLQLIFFFFEIDILKYLHIDCAQEICFKPLSAWRIQLHVHVRGGIRM